MRLTDVYMIAIIIVAAACDFNISGPHNLLVNPRLVFEEKHYWRLITNFLYFGENDLEVLFHVIFLRYYAKLLEDNYFRRRKADFFYMFFFCGIFLIGSVLFLWMAPVAAQTYPNVIFLSNSLTFVSIYVWSKLYSNIEVALFSIVTFRADFLPWVLFGTSILLGFNSWIEDLLGIITGHCYYFLKYVYPRLTGRRPLRTPGFIRNLFPDDERHLVFVFIRDRELRMDPPPA